MATATAPTYYLEEGLVPAHHAFLKKLCRKLHAKYGLVAQVTKHLFGTRHYTVRIGPRQKPQLRGALGTGTQDFRVENLFEKDEATYAYIVLAARYDEPAPVVPTPAEVAAKFLAQARADGFAVSVSDGGTLTVSTTFAPRDKTAYSRADMLGPMLLGLVRQRGAGSVWGTDGSGVGGHVGCENGYYRLNKSGCNSLVLKQIVKQLALPK